MKKKQNAQLTFDILGFCEEETNYAENEVNYIYFDAMWCFVNSEK